MGYYWKFSVCFTWFRLYLNARVFFHLSFFPLLIVFFFFPYFTPSFSIFSFFFSFPLFSFLFFPFPLTFSSLSHHEYERYFHKIKYFLYFHSSICWICDDTGFFIILPNHSVHPLLLQR